MKNLIYGFLVIGVLALPIFTYLHEKEFETESHKKSTATPSDSPTKPETNAEAIPTNPKAVPNHEVVSATDTLLQRMTMPPEPEPIEITSITPARTRLNCAFDVAEWNLVSGAGNVDETKIAFEKLCADYEKAFEAAKRSLKIDEYLSQAQDLQTFPHSAIKLLTKSFVVTNPIVEAVYAGANRSVLQRMKESKKFAEINAKIRTDALEIEKEINKADLYKNRIPKLRELASESQPTN